MKINVGDYARTKNYGISKILKIYNSTTTNYSSITLDRIDSFGRLGVDVELDRIIGEPSPNIIDLIEVGDYVNMHRVSNVFDEYITTEDDQITIEKENIKSIVTKEQFESMEYKICEENNE